MLSDKDKRALLSLFLSSILGALLYFDYVILKAMMWDNGIAILDFNSRGEGWLEFAVLAGLSTGLAVHIRTHLKKTRNY